MNKDKGFKPAPMLRGLSWQSWGTLHSFLSLVVKEMIREGDLARTACNQRAAASSPRAAKRIRRTSSQPKVNRNAAQHTAADAESGLSGLGLVEIGGRKCTGCLSTAAAAKTLARSKLQVRKHPSVTNQAPGLCRSAKGRSAPLQTARQEADNKPLQRHPKGPLGQRLAQVRWWQSQSLGPQTHLTLGRAVVGRPCGPPQRLGIGIARMTAQIGGATCSRGQA